MYLLLGQDRTIYALTHIRVGLMQEWAHQDLNLEPADYESDALTN